MANKKITELNEATSISNNDWLVMVDVANDETKKIHAGEVGGNIPIQDTAPQNPEENDLWIDTANDNTLKYYDGTSWNNVSDTIAGDTLPIGVQIPYGSTTPPENWLVCDGSYVSKTEYAELYAVIGDSYIGSGTAPAGTFRLPNKQGKVSVGYDSNDTDFNAIGKKGGSKNLQSHYHTAGTYDNYAINNTTTTAGGTANSLTIDTTSTTPSTRIKTNTAGTGDSGNLQPYETDCWIIKAKQSAGLVANVSNTYSESETDTYSCDYINNALDNIVEIIDVQKDITFTDYLATLSKTDLGVDSLTNYTWHIESNNWEYMYSCQVASASSLQIRGWHLSGLSSATINLLNSTTTSVRVVGIKK